MRLVLWALGLWFVSGAAMGQAVPRDASIATLRGLLDSGRLTSESLVQYYLHRIDTLNRQGPALHAIISVNPDAIGEARERDRERRAHHPLGPLEGIPILIKDNIETRDRMPTTAGSLALAKNFALHDAPVVASLRAAGAIILGKTNLSEWANFRSSRAMSGWSGVGGLTRNPYVLDRTACGSSSGSGAAVAADLAPAALGTETDGSVTCPASIDGLAGLKPTVGLLSQQGIVPISHSQDTAGPMAHSVEDVARLLSVMTGHDYLGALNAGRLQGMRIGVVRFKIADPELEVVFRHAVEALRAAGATPVEVDAPEMEPIQTAEQKVLLDEFKDGINAYLANTPATVPTRDLAALIAFNRNSRVELEYFGQELFEQAQATRGTEEPDYHHAREQSLRLAGAQGIDRLLQSHDLQVLITPTTTPAWRVDLVYGDASSDSFLTTLAAVAGYPHLSLPMGQVRGLPVGLSFVGPAQAEQLLLDCGLAFQRRAGGFVAPTFTPSLESQAFSGASAK